ncbi:MAG: hypothetical protein ABIQ89_01830 [Candidatus Saccharimonadales bacterium]
MMFLGLFTLVVLPLFLVVSAKVIKGGENDHMGRNIAAMILYVCAAVNVITGVALIINAL